VVPDLELRVQSTPGKVEVESVELPKHGVPKWISIVDHE
jgi:hypothetical protein